MANRKRVQQGFLEGFKAQKAGKQLRVSLLNGILLNDEGKQGIGVLVLYDGIENGEIAEPVLQKLDHFSAKRVYASV